jgi:gliding motility-associated-like protein
MLFCQSPLGLCNIFPDVDTLFLQTNCNQPAVLCTSLPLGLSSAESNNFQFRNRNRIVTPSEPCNFDTLRYYSAEGSILLSSVFAPFFIDKWQVNNRFFSGEFRSINDLIDSLNTWDQTGGWEYNSERRLITGGSSNNTYGKLTIDILLASTTLNFPYIIEPFAQNMGIPLSIGWHRITVINRNAQCRDTIAVQVLCTTTDTLSLKLDVGQTRTICFEERELAGNIVRIVEANGRLSNAYTFNRSNSNCLIFKGIVPTEDRLKIIFCDSFGICDTTLLLLQVQTKENPFQTRAIRKGETGRFCVDARTLGLPGTIQVFEQIVNVPTNQIGKVRFRVNASPPLGEAGNFCLEYEGLQLGIDTTRIRVCDQFGNCDTLRYRLTVVTPNYINDTLLINFDIRTHCFNTSIFTGRSLKIELDCRNNIKREIINTELDTQRFCLIYKGTKVGNDSLCVWLTDELGNAALTVFRLYSGPPIPTVIKRVLYINENIEICINNRQLPGIITNTYNICPEDSGEYTEMFLDADTRCVDITGLNLGKERLCAVACDNLGFCDTTYIDINVIAYPFLPVAENDTISTTQNQSITINVQANDNLIGGIINAYIAVPPKFGTAIFNADGTITYFPNEQSCRGSDQFSYFICNANGCDNAEVQIAITCSDIEIFTGFSPNGDGVNDYFFIANIEAKPNNHLQIFNQWGNLIYQTQSYKNDWDGKWNNKLLPDGTYYFILEIEENDLKNTYRGSIELRR